MESGILGLRGPQLDRKTWDKWSAKPLYLDNGKKVAPWHRGVPRSLPSSERQHERREANWAKKMEAREAERRRAGETHFPDTTPKSSPPTPQEPGYVSYYSSTKSKHDHPGTDDTSRKVARTNLGEIHESRNPDAGGSRDGSEQALQAPGTCDTASTNIDTKGLGEELNTSIKVVIECVQSRATQGKTADNDAQGALVRDMVELALQSWCARKGVLYS
jgi:hypothetical protein